MDHPDDTVLRRFAEAKSTREDNRDVVRHLLGGCEKCGRKVRSAYRPVTREEDYDPAIDRFIDWAKRRVRPRPRIALTPRILGH